MKILLINPPVPLKYYNREYYVPTGLLYLGATLKKNNDEIRLLDLRIFYKSENTENLEKFLGYYEEKIKAAIEDFRPELIGIGCLFSGQFPDVLKFSEMIKHKFKNLPILLGGIHPTIYPSEILANCPSFDWIIMGEGERSIIQLVNTIKDKKLDFEKIDGFAYRKNGKVIVNPKKHFIENLDAIPFPAYDLIDIKDYYIDTLDWHNPKNLNIKTSLPVISSRSCPNRCTFCSMYMAMGPRWRPRTPKNVVDEIEYLYHKYNNGHFSFMDDNMTFNKSHILDICNQIIKRKLNIEFETPNGLSLNTLDEEVVDALVAAGLVRIYLAIESGSEFIRNKIMKKNLSTEKIYEVIRMVKKYRQLYVKAFFIIGMPEETSETLEETYNMIKKIDAGRIYIHNIIPYPGTKVFEQAVRDNLLVGIDPKNFYKSDALYLTNFDRIFIKPYKLEVTDLQKFREKCYTFIAETQKIKKNSE